MLQLFIKFAVKRFGKVYAGDSKLRVFACELIISCVWIIVMFRENVCCNVHLYGSNLKYVHCTSSIGLFIFFVMNLVLLVES